MKVKVIKHMEKKIEYTISISELLTRPVIRDDFKGENSEWMNKVNG